MAVAIAAPPITYAAMNESTGRPLSERAMAVPVNGYAERPAEEEVSRSFQRPPLAVDEVYKLKRILARQERAEAQAKAAAATAIAATKAAEQNGSYWFGLSSEWAAMGPDQRRNATLAYRLIEHKPWFSQEQARCLDELWWQESEFKTSNPNPASEADGIPQANPASKMAASGSDWRTNAKTQELWGIGYIEERYGTPCDAEAHERSSGFY